MPIIGRFVCGSCDWSYKVTVPDDSGLPTALTEAQAKHIELAELTGCPKEGDVKLRNYEVV
jgi:hypothetical protein